VATFVYFLTDWPERSTVGQPLVPHYFYLFSDLFLWMDLALDRALVLDRAGECRIGGGAAGYR